MLKRKLDKAAYDALPDALKAYYKADGDSFKLSLETSADDDPAELRRALDRERQNAKDEKTRADRLQSQVDTLVADPSKQKDIATLEASWKQKLADKEAELGKKVDRLTSDLKKVLVTDRALALATKIAGDSADLLVPHIERRLQASLEGDLPTTRVLDGNGQLSAATIDDLEKEFVANKKYSAIIVASKASGGATTSRVNGTGAGGAWVGKKFNELSEQERVEWHKADPQGYQEAVAANRKATRRF